MKAKKKKKNVQKQHNESCCLLDGWRSWNTHVVSDQSNEQL